MSVNTDWTQVLTILGGNFAMFLWAIRMQRADYLHLDKKLEENRKETNALVKAIHDEIKDFHNRLCKIEMEKMKNE